MSSLCRCGAWLAVAMALPACTGLVGLTDLQFVDPTGGAGGTGASTETGGGTTGIGGSGGGTGGTGGMGGTGCILGPFGAPTEVQGVNTADGEWDPAVTADELTLYFVSPRSGAIGGDDIWVATRPTASSPFSDVLNVTELNSSSSDGDPELSAGGLAVYFGSTRTGGAGNYDIWWATRPSADDAFGAPQNVAELNTPASDRDPTLSADGLTIYFSSNRAGGVGGSDIWKATRTSLGSPFGAVTNVSAINTTSEDINPAISSDGLSIYFNSGRPGGSGSQDIWRATRGSLTESFTTVENVTATNTAYAEQDPTLSADGLSLYFGSDRFNGSYEGDLFVTTRSCQQ